MAPWSNNIISSYVGEMALGGWSLDAGLLDREKSSSDKKTETVAPVFVTDAFSHS